MARHVLPRGCRLQQKAGTTGITSCQQQEAAEIDHPDPKVFSDEFQAAQADNIGATTGPSQLKHRHRPLPVVFLHFGPTRQP